MSDNPYKGGRNHKAPYNTTLVRVPLEIKDALENIIGLYKRAYKSEANKVRLDLVESLKGFSRLFLESHSILVDSKNYVSIDKYNAVLKELENANHELAFLDSLKEELEDNCKRCTIILEAALNLKPNAGGAIKKEIRKAIIVLD